MKKLVSLLTLLSLLLLCFASCAGDETKINIGVMSGPTGMGMAKLMNDEAKKANSNYSFELFSSPEEATTKIAKGELDMLCLPTNVAANLSNKNDISVLAINTLGSLYLVSDKNTTVSSFAELEGKTIYASVPNSTTGPILNYLLEKNNVNAKIEFVADHQALAAKVIKGEVSIAVLPEPILTNALSKNNTYSVDLNLTTEWKKVSNEPLTMGCIVVRNEFLTEHNRAVEQFLDKYEDSIEYIGKEKNKDSAAQMILDQKIVPAFTTVEPVKNALDNLYGSIVFIDGSDMKDALKDFYTAIKWAQPKDSFYYDN